MAEKKTDWIFNPERPVTMTRDVWLIPEEPMTWTPELCAMKTPVPRGCTRVITGAHLVFVKTGEEWVTSTATLEFHDEWQGETIGREKSYVTIAKAPRFARLIEYQLGLCVSA